MADTIHRLINSINVAISEHAKGNTDHDFDTSDFRGDFRLLADSIIQLSHLGLKDQLTGLPNRRTLDGRLDLEWSRAMREKTSLSLLMIDVDHFKRYNDTYGHQQGDIVLQTVAKALTIPLKRGLDLAARWGGEEFVVLLPNTSAEGAMLIAERIRAEIEKTEIMSITGDATQKVTISIGVNTQIPSPDNSIVSLIAKADEALYLAKKEGRNRVSLYENHTPAQG
jgi:diguanylate cyclase (GGDEF)-like protein